MFENSTRIPCAKKIFDLCFHTTCWPLALNELHLKHPQIHVWPPLTGFDVSSQGSDPNVPTESQLKTEEKIAEHLGVSAQSPLKSSSWKVQQWIQHNSARDIAWNILESSFIQQISAHFSPSFTNSCYEFKRCHLWGCETLQDSTSLNPFRWPSWHRKGLPSGERRNSRASTGGWAGMDDRFHGTLM